MISPKSIQEAVESQLPGSKAEVRDLTGTNDHFELLVVAREFEGKGRIERHRLVYSLLGATVGAEIHALSIKAIAPSEEPKADGG